MRVEPARMYVKSSRMRVETTRSLVRLQSQYFVILKSQYKFRKKSHKVGPTLCLFSGLMLVLKNESMSGQYKKKELMLARLYAIFLPT
jgi:hypothetical protein